MRHGVPVEGRGHLCGVNSLLSPLHPVLGIEPGQSGFPIRRQVALPSEPPWVLQRPSMLFYFSHVTCSLL